MIAIVVDVDNGPAKRALERASIVLRGRPPCELIELEQSACGKVAIAPWRSSAVVDRVDRAAPCERFDARVSYPASTAHPSYVVFDVRRRRHWGFFPSGSLRDPTRPNRGINHLASPVTPRFRSSPMGPRFGRKHDLRTMFENAQVRARSSSVNFRILRELEHGSLAQFV